MKYGISRMMAVGALLAGSALGASASELRMADPEFTTQERIVSYADLDLANSADVATLHARLRVAARQVCPETANDVVSLDGKRLVEKCRRDSLRAAMKHLPVAVQKHHKQWLAAGARWVDRAPAQRTLEAAVRR